VVDGGWNNTAGIAGEEVLASLELSASAEALVFFAEAFFAVFLATGASVTPSSEAVAFLAAAFFTGAFLAVVFLAAAFSGAADAVSDSSVATTFLVIVLLGGAFFEAATTCLRVGVPVISPAPVGSLSSIRAGLLSCLATTRCPHLTAVTPIAARAISPWSFGEGQGKPMGSFASVSWWR
jgi:hypothetical protein